MGVEGQEGVQEGILTRADLPTPPEPNTTSLYSRMAGLLHRTAQQSALDKRGKAKRDKMRNLQKQRQFKKNKTRSNFLFKQNKGIFPVWSLSFSTQERKDSSHSWRLWTRSSTTMEGTPISGAASGWRR